MKKKKKAWKRIALNLGVACRNICFNRVPPRSHLDPGPRIDTDLASFLCAAPPPFFSLHSFRSSIRIETYCLFSLIFVAKVFLYNVIGGSPRSSWIELRWSCRTIYYSRSAPKALLCPDHFLFLFFLSLLSCELPKWMRATSHKDAFHSTFSLVQRLLGTHILYKWTMAIWNARNIVSKTLSCKVFWDFYWKSFTLTWIEFYSSFFFCNLERDN